MITLFLRIAMKDTVDCIQVKQEKYVPALLSILLNSKIEK